MSIWNQRTLSIFRRTAKTQLRLGRCPVWSEYLLGPHMQLCWFCHEVTYSMMILKKPSLCCANYEYLGTCSIFRRTAKTLIWHESSPHTNATWHCPEVAYSIMILKIPPLCCANYEYLRTRSIFKRTAKTLIWRSLPCAQTPLGFVPRWLILLWY